MRLINYTKYDTRVIKRCLRAINDHIEPVSYRISPERWRRLVVVVSTETRRYVEGRPFPLKGNISRAHFVAHTAFYIRWWSMGAAHSFKPPAEDELTQWYAWHKDFQWNTLPLKPEKPKTPPTKTDLVAQKLARVLQREKAWTTKLKRCETALKKLKARRKYYEKKQLR